MIDESDDDLSRLIRENATRHRGTPALDSAIRTELALQSAADHPSASGPHRRWPAWLFGGVGFAFGVVLSSVVVLTATHMDSGDRLAGELVGNHVRALMVSHLTDVASTDQHTVKPWFQGRLAYSPPVTDLAPEGFPLVGGRLDYLSGQAVAALVYRRNGHLINVFVWPDAAAANRKSAMLQGYNVVQWGRGGMTYAAVSDLNMSELRSFSEKIQ